jgi:GDP-D-mannose dehydratase
MMISKIKYIHQNPVKRGYVDEERDWRYSSARDYVGEKGLIEIERFW